MNTRKTAWIAPGANFVDRLLASDDAVGITGDGHTFASVLESAEVFGLAVVLVCWRLSEEVVATAGLLMGRGATRVTVWCDPITKEQDAAQVAALCAIPGCAAMFSDTHAKGCAVGDRLVLTSSNGDGRVEWNWWATRRMSNATGWLESALRGSMLPIGPLSAGPSVVPAKTVGSADLLDRAIGSRAPVWLANWNCCKALTRRLNERREAHVLLDAAVDRLNPEASIFRRQVLRATTRIQHGVHAKCATDGRVTVFTSANWQPKNLRSEAYWVVEDPDVAAHVAAFVETGRIDGVNLPSREGAVKHPMVRRDAPPISALLDSAAALGASLTVDRGRQMLLEFGHG
jgi:hypothetical protein